MALIAVDLKEHIFPENPFTEHPDLSTPPPKLSTRAHMYKHGRERAMERERGRERERRRERDKERVLLAVNDRPGCSGSWSSIAWGACGMRSEIAMVHGDVGMWSTNAGKGYMSV